MPAHISLIIPIYNGAQHLPAALASARAQTRPPDEIIVVDDGSTDDSAALARAQPDVRLLTQANAGPGAARNAGLAAAQGGLLAFLDQDDEWLPEKLARQLDCLQAHPEVMYVLCHQHWYLEPGQPPPAWVRPERLEASQTGFAPSTLLARRAVFAQVGLFDPALRLASDMDWFFRANDLGVPMQHLPETLVRRRIHASNQSATTEAYQAEIAAVARASIRRKRAGGHRA
jgi:glycosyltransferase involved in cell wall biosynthesis